MDLTTERFQLMGRLDDIDAELNDPLSTADLEALAREKAGIVEALKALDGRQQAARDNEYRAGIDARREAFYRDLSEPMGWLRENLPRLRYELVRMQEMENRMDEDGTGRHWVEITNGFPAGAPARIQRAIADEVRGTVWEECYTPPSLLKGIIAGRDFAKRKAAEEAAARQAAYDEAQVRFERGEGPDPRLLQFRIRALG
jgi:hypothetical protein